MRTEPLEIVVIGLSLTSSWGNGHATTYRSLLRELARLGHDVLFLERDVPWYRSARDLPEPEFARCELYASTEELRSRFAREVERADVVIQGSYVPDGIEVAEWVLSRARGVTAFYDIDTPVTLSQLEAGECDYLSPELIGGFDLYLSFAGGPALKRLEEELKARRALPLYCSVDVDALHPDPREPLWELGYMGTYSPDRQPGLESLLLEPARRLGRARFCVAGPQYPAEIVWPENVEYREHLPPPEHRGFYGAQKFTLNLTRDAMKALGYSPSVRLFEAAACATPIVSDRWDGLGEFFRIDQEILVADSPEEVVSYLSDIGEPERLRIGERARARVAVQHSASRRAEELIDYIHYANRY